MGAAGAPASRNRQAASRAMLDRDPRMSRGHPSRIKLGAPKIYKIQKSRSQGFAIALLAKASDYSVFSPEITMPKINLSGMTVEALMDLRNRVDEMLLERRTELEKQLERFA